MADIVTNMNELHKKVYNDKRKVPNLIPDVAKIQKSLIKFESKQKLGQKFVVGVRLAYPGGFTKAKGDGTAGAFALNEVRGGTQKAAELDPYQLLLRDQMSYEDAGKAVEGEASFIDGVGFFYEGLQLSARKELEALLLYGSSGVGVVETYTAGDPSIVIKAAEFAAQLWAGREGHDVTVMSGATSTARGTVTITKVDTENRKIWLSGTVTGAAADDVLYIANGYGKEMPGIHKILSNTGSMFGIDAGTYSLWKGSHLSLASKPLSFQSLKRVLTMATNKGLYGKMDILVNPASWDDLQESVEGTRSTTDKDVKKVEIGTEEILYHSQNGTSAIHSHPMVKQGYAYGLFTQSWKRVGSVDLQLGAPGFDTPWFHLPSNAGIEARIYTNQGIISEQPGWNFMVSGIVNSTP